MKIIWTFLIIASPTQVLFGVIGMMWFLLLMSCGFFLLQPTVIGSFFRKISFLSSGRARHAFFDLWGREVQNGRTLYMSCNIKILKVIGKKTKSHFLCPLREIMKEAGVRTILKRLDLPIGHFGAFYPYFSGNMANTFKVRSSRFVSKEKPCFSLIFGLKPWFDPFWLHSPMIYTLKSYLLHTVQKWVVG